MLQGHIAATKRCVVHTEATFIRVAQRGNVADKITTWRDMKGHVAATYPWDMYPQHFHVCAHVVILSLGVVTRPYKSFLSLQYVPATWSLGSAHLFEAGHWTLEGGWAIWYRHNLYSILSCTTWGASFLWMHDILASDGLTERVLFFSSSDHVQAIFSFINYLAGFFFQNYQTLPQELNDQPLFTKHNPLLVTQLKIFILTG